MSNEDRSRPWVRWQGRVANQLERITSDGLSKTLASDRDRIRREIRRALWRVTHDDSPNAVPIYIVGLQRSGTNMLLGAFDQAPEAEIHNESNDSVAFSNWMLRSDDVVRTLIQRSRHRAIVFKPLCDCHRVVHLIEGLGVPSSGRAIWIYRDVADRVRSVWAKWPGEAGEIGHDIVAGLRAGWATGGVSEARLAVVAGFDPAKITPASGAALFWYVRNGLFFDLALHQRPDVALISYDRLVAEPERYMPALCEFAGIRFRRDMISNISRRPPPKRGELDIDPDISALCGELQQRLDDEFERRLAAGVLHGPSCAAPQPDSHTRTL